MSTGKTVYELFKRDIGQRAELSPDERLGLFSAAQRGDRIALNRLVKDNAPLVIKIAWRYVDSDNAWFNINDLVQEGCLGLIRAIEKFDPTRGKFSDYAGHWIRQRVTMYLARSDRLISLPREVYDLLLKYNRLSASFQIENGYRPSPEEIGFTENETGIIERAERATTGNFNLDNYEVDDEFDHNIYCDQIRESLEDAIDNALTENEAVVIRARWLSKDGLQPTHLEIANSLGVSKQAIADREKRALKKLKRSWQKSRKEN